MKISEVQQIQIEDYNYPLPDDKIAKYPLKRRDESKLLVYCKGEITEDVFKSIDHYLPDNSLLIYNNTKVIQARLHFQKPTGAQVEIFCLEPYRPHDYALIFQQTKKCSWLCLIGNLKKWKEGTLLKTIKSNGKTIEIQAKRVESIGESHIIEFEWNDSSTTFAELLDLIGELPIPPYLNRKTEESDHTTYQTVFSKIKGSVAAPTAGLHFTKEVFERLKSKGIETDEVTLHVGAGTFKPVKTETIKEHSMHAEFISVSKSTIENLLNCKRKIIAVGTTSVRTLESLYYIGCSIKAETPPDGYFTVSQWQPYQEENSTPTEQALTNILEYLNKNKLDSLFADTQIMIAPGYRFKVVNGIITNFHQPQSTLLLLVSAFVKGDWKKIYKYALSHDFRFLSYGDSSLLLDI